MSVQPLDRQPGLSEADVKLLHRWRTLPETIRVFAILAATKPLAQPASPETLTAESSAYRLGVRDGHDTLYTQLYLVGMTPKAESVPRPDYGGKSHARAPEIRRPARKQAARNAPDNSASGGAAQG